MPFSSSLTSKSRPQSGQLTISPEMTSSGISISPSHSGHLALKVTASFHFMLYVERIFFFINISEITKDSLIFALKIFILLS